MRFSVIIPVYNVAAELPRTMASLQVQTYRDFEIVLVDDGSTDGSAALVDSYVSVATVIHQPNSGVVVARQKGFEASKGEWILFVDGDDRLKPRTLECIAAEIDRTHPDVVQFGYEMIRGGKKDDVLPPERGACAVDDLLARMKKTPLEFVEMCIGNKCYRREIVTAAFADVGDVHISHSEDGLFAFAAFLRAGTVSFLSECFYEYILRTTSAVHRVNTKIVTEKGQFVARLECLMKSSGRLSIEQVGRCLDFHCYESACYIFLMLRRNHADRQACCNVLRALNESSFFRRPNEEWCSLKRKMMRFLLAHPRFYILFSPLIDAVYV